jgi:surface protein
MDHLFGFTSINAPIGNWNTGNVSDMRFMFEGDSAFNQPIGNWNTSNVENMHDMFNSCINFNQDLGSWNLGSVILNDSMFYSCGLNCENYGNTLIGWATQNNLPTGLSLGSVNTYVVANGSVPTPIAHRLFKPEIIWYHKKAGQ